MKKAAALLLAMILVLGMTACGGNSSASEPASQPAKTEADTKAAQTDAPKTTEAPATAAPTTQEATTAVPTTVAPAIEAGWYKLVEWSQLGSPEEIQKYAASGIAYFLVIEEGNRGYFHMAGEEHELEWDEENINIDQVGRNAYKAEGTTLSLLNNGTPYMTFERSEEAAPARGETMKAAIGLYRTDEIILKDVTLADTADYTIAVKEIIPPKKPHDDYKLVLSLTSKIAGDNLGFGFSHAVINGITLATNLSNNSCTVKAGETKEYELPIPIENMKEAGVGDPTRIDLYTHIKPNYQAKDTFLGYLTLYPLGEEKAETVTRQAGEKDQLIEDNDKVRLTFIGISGPDIINYYHTCFWLENKTDEVARSQIFIHTVNGTDARFFSITEIAPHSACLLTALMSPDELNGLSPDAITDLALSFDLSTNSVNPKTITEGEYSVKP
ncbi:MAG: hypothetical protein IJL47_09710 [Lachnospiraceae bacterium]|nr:hypothetical protein [Lachnospiraceae bacterium]